MISLAFGQTINHDLNMNAVLPSIPRSNQDIVDEIAVQILDRQGSATFHAGTNWTRASNRMELS